MKVVGWIATIIFLGCIVAAIVYQAEENRAASVALGEVTQIYSTILEKKGSVTKFKYLVVRGVANNGSIYNRDVEVNYDSAVKIGDTVSIKKPLELKPEVVIKERAEDTNSEEDGLIRQEKKE